MQSMHKPGLVRRPIDKLVGRPIAQPMQRGFSVVNRARHARHTGSAGQLRQTAHWLGSSIDGLDTFKKGFCKRRLNTRSIYSGRYL